MGHTHTKSRRASHPGRFQCGYPIAIRIQTLRIANNIMKRSLAMATYFPDHNKPFPLKGLAVVVRHTTDGSKQVLALRPGAWADLRDAKREKTGYEQTFAGLFDTGEGLAVSYKVTVNVKGAE